jgi:hypothetical protein
MLFNTVVVHQQPDCLIIPERLPSSKKERLLFLSFDVDYLCCPRPFISVVCRAAVVGVGGDFSKTFSNSIAKRIS